MCKNVEDKFTYGKMYLVEKKKRKKERETLLGIIEWVVRNQPKHVDMR